jgi:hypothetical protein
MDEDIQGQARTFEAGRVSSHGHTGNDAGVFAAPESVCALMQSKTNSNQTSTNISPGCGDLSEDGGEESCVLPSCALFDAVSASLPRTLEIEPTDPNCTVDMVCEWCSSLGPLHCITSSVTASRPRVTVTYVDSRDCKRAKEDVAKIYPAVAIECSTDEADHDLTGALRCPGLLSYLSVPVRLPLRMGLRDGLPHPFTS